MIHKLVCGLEYAAGHYRDPLIKARYQLCEGYMSDKPRGDCSYHWLRVSCPKCLKIGKRKGCLRTSQQKQLGGSRGKA